MKRFISVLLIVLVLVSLTAPAFSEDKTILNAIPARYYAPIIAGAVLQVYLQNQVAPMNGFNVMIGLAIAKQAFDHFVLGETFDWNEAASTVLGADIIYQLSF